MKVVFVASGNKSVGTVSSFVRSQFESLQREGLEMELFPVVGHGWKAYLRAAIRLRKLIRKNHPDVVHAHYSVCGLVAALATWGFRTKVVVSILGSFPKENFKLHWVRFFIKHIWDATLTKSQRTANQLGLKLPVVPNGVNLAQFSLIDQQEARSIVGFAPDKQYVIWCSHPSRPEKRFRLAEKAVKLLNNDNVELVAVCDKPHDEVVKYMCAADMLLLTSVSEGSPNVIKEAMSCNCPLVSTDVGDVQWVTEGVEGTYVAMADDPQTISDCISKALAFGKRTSGREQILAKGLTTECIASKIIAIYDSL